MHTYMLFSVGTIIGISKDFYLQPERPCPDTFIVPVFSCSLWNQVEDKTAVEIK